METFLPYANLTDSVATYERFVLSRVRRSIPRILDVLHEVEGAPQPVNHPEIERWRDHEPFLCEFGFIVNARFAEICRNIPQYVETSLQHYSNRISYHLECATSGEFTMEAPKWWGVQAVHDADKAALLRLEYDHYSNYFEGVALSLPPHWMVRHG